MRFVDLFAGWGGFTAGASQAGGRLVCAANDLWLECFRRLGYKLTSKVLRASHMGAPQRRDRLFIVGSLDREVSLDFAREPEPGFGACIEWDAAADWTPVAQATTKVRERIAKALKRLGHRRFLTQHVTNHPGVPLDEPIRTITTADQWAVVDGDHYRPLTIRENARGMGFPDGYGWPEGANRSDLITGLGNAVCPPQATRIFTRVADVASVAPAA